MSKNLIAIPLKNWYDYDLILKLHYFYESWARDSYDDGEDNYYGVRVCYVSIQSPNENLPWVHSWYHTRVKSGKGFAEERDKFIQLAREWFGAYTYEVNYPVPMRCNCLGHNRLICPNISLGNTSCGCSIFPSYWGYGSGFTKNPRPFPENMECDIYKIMGGDCERAYTWDIPGSSLSLRDYWRCSTGEAKKTLERYKKTKVEEK